MSKMGVGQNTFETRKMIDLWLTSHNFFGSEWKIVTVIFSTIPARPSAKVIILDISIDPPI
jgi:hypothetical protein